MWRGGAHLVRSWKLGRILANRKPGGDLATGQWVAEPPLGKPIIVVSGQAS